MVSRVCISHVTHIKNSCHTYELVTHLNVSFAGGRGWCHQKGSKEAEENHQILKHQFLMGPRFTLDFMHTRVCVYVCVCVVATK